MPENLFRFASAIALALIALVCPALVAAQTPSAEPPGPRPKLVTWQGPGAIPLPTGGDWKGEALNVYDRGTRPVVRYAKGDSGLTVSFILFQRDGGDPTPQGCLADVLKPIVKGLDKQLSERIDAETKNATGQTLATSSYLVDINLAGVHGKQRNLFAFAANAHTCAEVHISTTRDTAADNPAMAAIVSDFAPDLAYQPVTADYVAVATLLFRGAPGQAAPYYNSALHALPAGTPPTSKTRRIITDQLVMSLGMAHDLKDMQTIAKKAIADDPEYPLNYYNLACADAEMGNAAEARVHLQQAFDHRANVLKGETLPDPASDESILKLKKDEAFWNFVLALPKS